MAHTYAKRVDLPQAPSLKVKVTSFRNTHSSSIKYVATTALRVS